MNNKYDLTIGIEIHVQTKTNSKMFSNSRNIYDAKQNTNINEIDLGYPGTKPLVNKEAFNLAVRLAKAFNMEIAKKTNFDRKHYFYHDLPKGFQITQFFNPIGKKGTLKLPNGNKIGITQIHMEEDTAKQNNVDGKKYIDYNRAGTPLVEIVTDHTTINSVEDAMLFVKTLRSLLIFHDISDAKMNEGSMRCDVNISIKPKGQKQLGNKVEIKNINSVNNIKDVIEKEVAIQEKTLEAGKEVLQSTKRYDDGKKEVVMMREKSDAVDYLYFRETNIPTIQFTDKDIEKITGKDEDFIKFVNENVSELKIDYNKFLEFVNKKTFYIFKNLKDDKEVENKNMFNVLESIIAKKINENSEFKLESIDLNTYKLLFISRSKNQISQQQVGEIIDELMNNSKFNVQKFIKDINDSKMGDDDLIKVINDILDSNQSMVEKYKDRPENLERFLMGQLMKETKGRINPQEAMKLVKTTLSK